MALEISAAELERRRLVTKLMGRFFPIIELPHSLIYSHGEIPRLPVATLPEDGHLPLRSDKPFVALRSRTVLKTAPSRS
jgi:hypothetical protein